MIVKINKNMNYTATNKVDGKFIIENSDTKEIVLETPNKITNWGMTRIMGHPYVTGSGGSRVYPSGALCNEFRYFTLGSDASPTGGGKWVSEEEAYTLGNAYDDFEAWVLDTPVQVTGSGATGLLDGFWDGIKGETLYKKNSLGQTQIVFKKSFKIRMTADRVISEIGISSRPTNFPINKKEWPIQAYGGNPSKLWNDGTQQEMSYRVQPTRWFVNGRLTNLPQWFDIDVRSSSIYGNYGRMNNIDAIVNTLPNSPTVPQPTWKVPFGIFSRKTFSPRSLVNGSSYTITYEFTITLTEGVFVENNAFQPDRTADAQAALLPDFPTTKRSIRNQPFIHLTEKGIPQDRYYGNEQKMPPILDSLGAGEWVFDMYQANSSSAFSSVTNTISSTPSGLYDWLLKPSLANYTGGLLTGNFTIRAQDTQIGIPGVEYDHKSYSAYDELVLWNPVYGNPSHPLTVDRENTWQTTLEFVTETNFWKTNYLGAFKLARHTTTEAQLSATNLGVDAYLDELQNGIVTVLSGTDTWGNYTSNPLLTATFYFKPRYTITFVRG